MLDWIGVQGVSLLVGRYRSINPSSIHLRFSQHAREGDGAETRRKRDTEKRSLASEITQEPLAFCAAICSKVYRGCARATLSTGQEKPSFHFHEWTVSLGGVAGLRFSAMHFASG